MVVGSNLDFERPVAELKAKIEELRRFMQETGIDLSHEVVKLEERLEEVSANLYSDLTAWQRIQLARHSARPTTLDYIKGMCSEFVELHGDRNFRDDPAVVGVIGLLDGHPVTIIGHQKGHDTKENIFRNFGSAHPEGYRKAMRLMKQAEKFQRPVIAFIDTQGAYPGMSSEERGISQAIAENLVAMAGLRTPTIAIVTGEGGSGGAIGFGVADRVFILEHAWYSVISPESAAAILWKDSSQAPKAAESMKMTAGDLHQLGVVDQVIAEPRGGAHKDPQSAITAVRDVVVEGLRELAQLTIDDLLDQRYHKYRNLGSYTER